ncbi:MAG: addiction module antidote protein, HigA family [Candidatus Parabeggiatoa sp. nov. 1]|nr:MAG: addiction module antidote protein, HigA family [Gammaproteobacteria bacterium]
MNNANINQYNPDIYAAPGKILKETIEYMGMSSVELSERTAVSQMIIDGIIQGQAQLTPEIALKLEIVLDIPAHFWLNLERTYREALARQAEKEQFESQVEWLKLLPLRAMTELGWIQRCPNKIEQLQELLRFFGIASTETWQNIWEKEPYNQSPAFQRYPQAVSAWLRQGERMAQKIECEPYEGSKFQATLHNLRALTTQSPEAFLPEVQRLCALSGVAVVLVPELPKKIKLSTATRLLASHKALIQLSERYFHSEHFWLIFFQQAGHILLHSQRKIFLDDALENAERAEAQEFAINQLVPEAEVAQFLSSQEITPTSIHAFAQRLGIAPGIVIGQLQHRRISLEKKNLMSPKPA